MIYFFSNKSRLFTSTILTFLLFESLAFNLSSKIKLSVFEFFPKAVARETIIEEVAKSTGGRSGGGSFKKRSSGSSSSKRKRSSSSRSSSSYSSPSSSSYYHNSSGSGNGFVGVVFLLLLGGFAVCLVTQNNSTNFASEKATERERDNNIVTISKLQVALLAGAKNVQKHLSELSLSINTDTDEGLLELLRESVLILLRNSDYWHYVLSSSESLAIDRAESRFQQLSVVERSKFSAETLSNVDGKIRQREAISPDEPEQSAYILVTLILGTANDRPLFKSIYSSEDLKLALEKIASIRDDYLMKFELLWSPQTEEDSLSEDELIAEYTDMIRLF